MKIYTQQEAFESCLSYFHGDDLAANVWISKYALKDKDGNLLELNPHAMHMRLAKELSRIEEKYPNPMSYEDIYELLFKFRYLVPQGGPMSGIGNPYMVSSLSNCFVIGNGIDSYGGIMRSDEEQAQLMKRRGGVGQDLSHLRPNGAYANGSRLAGETGMTCYMERYSNTTREVQQGGRRGALMLTVDVRHPDAERFIDKKMEEGKVTGANISVKLNRDFIVAALNSADFVQTFPIDLDHNGEKMTEFYKDYDEYEYNVLYDLGDDCYAKVINAKALWEKIIHNAWKSAEPGVLFWDKIIEESPADAYGPEWETISTNPCGELPLPKYDSCRLLAINLYSYVKNPFTSQADVDWDLFADHVQKAQRLMDDIIDLEIEQIDKILEKVTKSSESFETKYVEHNLWTNIRDKAERGRRTGLGVTAVGDMVAALNLTYGTPETTWFIGYTMKQLASNAYKSSINLAKERGCFPDYHVKLDLQSKYMERIMKEGNLKPEDYGVYAEYGRRNIACLTIAPTGTTSLMTQTSSGIEPAFKIQYYRRKKTEDERNAIFTDQQGDMWEEYSVFHHKFVKWYSVRYGLPETLALRELQNMDDTEVNMLISESPYYNATSDTVDYIEKVKLQGEAQKWIDHSISVTVNMPEHVKEETVAEVYKEAYYSGCKGITVYREGSRAGVLVSKPNAKTEDDFEYIDAYKRPKTVDCDITFRTAMKKQWVVLVGIVKGKPYEIFCVPRESIKIPSTCETGTITKKAKGVYELKTLCKGKEYKVDNIVPLMQESEQNQTRDYSAMLRHRIDPIYIIDQIQSYASVSSFQKVIERVLKQYVQYKKSAEDCPNCPDVKLIFGDGCVVCPNCGYSKCG